MAYIIKLPTFGDERGMLSVAEKIIPFEIKRFYCIYDVTCKRGGHRHIKNRQALMCVGGECKIYVNNAQSETIYVLDKPSLCLIVVECEDWHTMDEFSKGATLLVLPQNIMMLMTI